MLFGPHQKIVFIGNSITDCGRRGEDGPYGNGYVSMARNFLIARYPELQLTFVNKGVGGDTVRQLADRWEQDVIRERPDWLSVKIGINDVWRAFGNNPHEAVPLEEYRATLHRLLRQTREATGARLILMEPYMIEPDRAEPMRREMDRFGAAVGELAAEFDAPLVRTQAAFDAALATTPPEYWAGDQIHPNAPGHALIALAFLRTIGFDL
jgi:lysophospholipase L1-like esterase